MLRAIFPFPTVFSTHLENFLPFSSSLKLSSANSFSLKQSKNLSFGKGLRGIEVNEVREHCLTKIFSYQVVYKKSCRKKDNSS